MTPRILLLAVLAAVATTGVPAASAQNRHTPAKTEPTKAPAKTVPSKAAPAPKDNARYGNWDRSWGTQPPAPPKHFAKHGDWYRHVRACQRAYRSYNAHTDSYRSRSGKTVRCKL